MKRRGIETKLIIGGQPLGQPDSELIKTIAKARHWYEGLKTGRLSSIGDIRTTEKMDGGDVSRMLPLAFLAPSIISEIISGNHPVDLTPRELMRKAARLPLNWEDQHSFLGMKT
jgi:hypothetical protein